MPQALQLVHSPTDLLVRIVSGSDCSHTSRLVTCIALRAVVEVRIGATGTISIWIGVESYHVSRPVGGGMIEARNGTYTQMFPVIAICGHR